MRSLAFAMMLLALPALARDVSGVNVPEKVQVEGQTLTLNGAGLRKKWMFKVYVIGLYAAQPTHDAKTLILGAQPKFIRMKLLRSVDKDKIIESIREGFEKNSKGQMKALNDRLLQLGAAVPDLKEGDELTFTILPGKGTKLGGVAHPTTIDGADFAEALLAVWLGDDPVDGDLKAALLGNPG